MARGISGVDPAGTGQINPRRKLVQERAGGRLQCVRKQARATERKAARYHTEQQSAQRAHG